MNDEASTIGHGSQSVLDLAAVQRQEVWEMIGMPMSPMYMSEETMNREYRGRFSCVNADVLREAQQALKFIACPKCVVHKDYGEITVTRLHIRVQDDIMNVFKAMARCFCYNCAHEEYWPLQRDPRATDTSSEAYIQEMLRQRQDALRARYPPPFGGVPSLGGVMGIGDASLLGGIGNNYGAMGQNRFAGMQMTDEEREALHRQYQKMASQAGSPPLMPPTKTATEVRMKHEGMIEQLRKMMKP